MAKKFKSSIDLQKNQLLQAAFENRSSNPTNPVLGQVYYNSTGHCVMVCTGISPVLWAAITSGGVSYENWKPVSFAVTGDDTLDIDTGGDHHQEIMRSLIRCSGSKFGYISETGFREDGSTYIKVCMSDPLDTNDTNFEVAFNIKVDQYATLMSVPGDLFPSNDIQGNWIGYVAVPSLILPIDVSLTNLPEGVDVYCNVRINESTNLFTTDINLHGDRFVQAARPDVNEIGRGDNLSVIVTDMAGISTATNLQVRVYVIPKTIIGYGE